RKGFPSHLPPSGCGAADACRARTVYVGAQMAERLERRFEAHVHARPDALAVADNRGRRLTRDELWQAARRRADELARHGVGLSDVVLIDLPNWAEWQVCFLAPLLLEAVPAT